MYGNKDSRKEKIDQYQEEQFFGEEKQRQKKHKRKEILDKEIRR